MSWRAIQHFYQKKIERLQEALNQPEIRDEATEVLPSLLECVVIAPVEEGSDVNVIGEIAQMIEVSMGEGGKKGPILNERMGRSGEKSSRGPATILICSFRNCSRQSSQQSQSTENLARCDGAQPALFAARPRNPISLALSLDFKALA